MKGSTMLATLQNLGVVPSFSRVFDANPFIEALFRTVNYCPECPSGATRSPGTATIADPAVLPSA
jgi:putative transposase